MVSECEKVFGPVEILVNKAGIIGPVKPIHELTETEWDNVMDTNLKGIFLCIKRVLPEMLKRGSGRIVNISSVNGFTGENLISAYTASKAGVIHLTKSAAIEYSQYGIRINAICPSIARTPLVEHFISMAENPDEARVRMENMNPLPGLISVECIANSALFLVSDDSEFITGIALPIDGGSSAGRKIEA